jgi:hypothetical protein
MSERDPRVDPKVGDELRKGAQVRTITKVLSGDGIVTCDIRYTTNTNRQGAIFLPNFIRWAKTAEVIRHAQ